MKKLTASLALAFAFLITPAHSWSIKEALHQANTTLVKVGDFCSGTIIDQSRGLIATAAHCADDLKVTTEHQVLRPNDSIISYSTTSYKPVDVTITNFDDQGNQTGEQKYKTTVVKAVFPQDVAILKSLSSTKLPGEVKINTTPVSYGDKVYTVGNPLMVTSVIAEGHIVKPQFPFPSAPGTINVIMYDAFMTHGSSGGGLFNDNGELIGLTNWGRDGGPNLASPVQNLVDLLATIDLGA